MRYTAWPLFVVSGIIADYSLTDCNYTRNKGKIAHNTHTHTHTHTHIYIYIYTHTHRYIWMYRQNVRMG